MLQLPTIILSNVENRETLHRTAAQKDDNYQHAYDWRDVLQIYPKGYKNKNGLAEIKY